MSRTRMSRLRSIAVLAACVAVCVLAPQAHAQEQDEAFKDGLAARDARKWQEAAAQMRRAIQADPTEGPRKVRRGLGGILGGGTEYLPHFFLGEALFNLGDCVGAMEAWTVSEQQGAVRSRPESVAFLQKSYAACEAKGVLSPGRYVPLLARTRQQVTDVTTLAATISASGQSYFELWRPDMREQYDKASGDLQNAQSRLASATRTRSERDFTDASTLAERARSALKSLESQLNAAIALHGTMEGIVKEVEQAVAAGTASDKVLAGKKALLTPALAAARQSANEAMARARTQTTAGLRTSNVAALSEARAIAQDAAVKLKQVLDSVITLETRVHERRVDDAVTLAQEALSFADGGLGSLDRLATEKPASVPPNLAEERSALEKQVAAARRRLDAARQRRDLVGLQDAARVATEARARLDALISSFGPVTIVDRGVRPALVEGARLFLAGDYEQSLTALDPASLADVPLQLHVHLLRAASQYALYVRSGERDVSRRTQAIAEVERVKQLNPDFQPDERAFAPRFISFFLTGQAAPPRAGASPSSQP